MIVCAVRHGNYKRCATSAFVKAVHRVWIRVVSHHKWHRGMLRKTSLHGKILACCAVRAFEPFGIPMSYHHPVFQPQAHNVFANSVLTNPLIPLEGIFHSNFAAQCWATRLLRPVNVELVYASPYAARMVTFLVHVVASLYGVSVPSRTEQNVHASMYYEKRCITAA